MFYPLYSQKSSHIKYLEDSDNIFRAAIIPLSPRKPPGQCPGGLFHSQFINLQTLDVVSSLYFLISRKGLERLSRRPCLWNHTSNHLFRNIFKFLSVSCCCQSVDCIVAHHQRRLCNCTKECSILNCCFDDRTSIETNTDNITVSCVRTKNVQVSISCKNTFCCCLVGTEDSNAVFLRKDCSEPLWSKALQLSVPEQLPG